MALISECHDKLEKDRKRKSAADSGLVSRSLADIRNFNSLGSPMNPEPTFHPNEIIDLPEACLVARVPVAETFSTVILNMTIDRDGPIYQGSIRRILE